MKLTSIKIHTLISGYKNGKKGLYILIAGLALTALITYNSYRITEKQENEEFTAICKEIELKITTRLHAHVLILRAGAAHFGTSDTVTRAGWKKFIELSKIEKNLPGILGVGYSQIIEPNELSRHIQKVKSEGFPDYKVYPNGKRDLYTAIIYLEPFTGRNLRAFGYDMFSEPVRRKAMELSRDNDVAMLSGRVDLVQETTEDIQAGTLMYVPFYKPGLPVNTVEERRAAILGWVYSPYRMDDLMEGIIGERNKIDESKIRLQVYDDSISVNSLLHDSDSLDAGIIDISKSRIMELPVEFNGKKWILLFDQNRKSFLSGTVYIVFVSGLIISILLFLLAVTLFNVQYRSQQINLQNHKLQTLNSEKDKFFSIIAHDLKSPFNTILGFSQLLEEQIKEKKYENTEEFANIIFQSSNRAMNLLMNLMEWSQSQTGRLVFAPETYNLAAQMREISVIFSDTALKKFINLAVEAPPEITIFADKNMISTVLRNLISNAIKFTYPNGKITVSAKLEEKNITVSVTDTGTGIPKDVIPKLLHIDSKYTTQGTQNEKGTGLGLILCKEFVEKHQGIIWIKSMEGKGSTFYFSIPRLENSTTL